ncbi:hypothetical protein PilKf_02577 [Pillotina sp. SPG140]
MGVCLLEVCLCDVCPCGICLLGSVLAEVCPRCEVRLCGVYGKMKTHRLVLWDAIPCKEFHDVVAYSYGSCLSRENNKSTTPAH